MSNAPQPDREGMNMATESQRNGIADKLLEILRAAPQTGKYGDDLKKDLSSVETEGKQLDLTQVERDALSKAVISLAAGLRLKGPKGDEKRQWARADIGTFRSGMTFPTVKPD
jgi:trans-2-enoyl-CoA reductase